MLEGPDLWSPPSFYLIIVHGDHVVGGIESEAETFGIKGGEIFEFENFLNGKVFGLSRGMRYIEGGWGRQIDGIISTCLVIETDSGDNFPHPTTIKQSYQSIITPLYLN